MSSLDAPLTVVSNRLPVSLARSEEGEWTATESVGGLVSALEPVLASRGGAWVGWSGSAGQIEPDAHDALARHGAAKGMDLLPVALSEREMTVYYEGACNQTLWPLLHGLPELSHRRPSFGEAYRTVNRRFADVASSVARNAKGAGDAVVWVHDYHLLGTGTQLRHRLPRARLGLFLHTPFPEPAVMLRLPWGGDLLTSLESFDLVGFQTERDRRNFHAWSETLQWLRESRGEGVERARPVRTGTFPISVDWAAFHDEAQGAEVKARAARIRDEVGGRQILLGVDRLDYTKGIPARIDAFERLLEEREALRGRVVLMQIAVPSREGVAEYVRERQAVEERVARVNARFAVAGWTPVQYTYGTWERPELLARYVAADVLVVTPVRDGMNLVAKEFVAANPGTGVLVLSRGAGAWTELGVGAVMAEPHDIQGMASALFTALSMSPEERADRITTMQDRLREHDVHQWAASFLAALSSAAVSVRREGALGVRTAAPPYRRRANGESGVGAAFPGG